MRFLKYGYTNMKTIEIDRKSWRYKIAVHPIPFLRERFEPRDRCSFRWMVFTGLVLRMLADLLIVVSGGVMLYGLTIVLFTTIHNFGMSMDIPVYKFVLSLIDAYAGAISDAASFLMVVDEESLLTISGNPIVKYLLIAYWVIMGIFGIVVPFLFVALVSMVTAVAIGVSIIALIGVIGSVIVDKMSETKPAEVIGGINHDIKEKLCAYVKYHN